MKYLFEDREGNRTTISEDVVPSIDLILQQPHNVYIKEQLTPNTVLFRPKNPGRVKPPLKYGGRSRGKIKHGVPHDGSLC